MKKLYITLTLLTLVGTATLFNKKPTETKADLNHYLQANAIHQQTIENGNASYSTQINFEYATNISVVNGTTDFTINFSFIEFNGMYANTINKNIETFHAETPQTIYTIRKQFVNEIIDRDYAEIFFTINSITPDLENDLYKINFNILIEELGTNIQNIGASFEINVEDDTFNTSSSNGTTNFIYYNRYTTTIIANGLQAWATLDLNGGSAVNDALYQKGIDEVKNNPNEYGLLTPSQAENLQGAEVIDIPGMMFNILTMPFTFISQAFDVTLFEGTIYQLNISNLIKSVIAVLTILFIFHLFTNGFDAVSNLNKNINTKVDNVNKQTRSNNKANKSKPAKKEE